MTNIDYFELKEILNNSFKIFPENKTIDFDELLSSKWEFIVLSNPAEKVFRRGDLLEYLFRAKQQSTKLSILNCDVDFSVISLSPETGMPPLDDYNSEIAIILDESGEILGLIDRFRQYKQLVLQSKRRLWQKDLKINFFQQIFDVMEDDIFITDEYGFIQYMNPRGEQVCQIKLDDYIGKHVTDMEKDKIISQSITLEVLRTGKRAERAVRLSSGRLIMAIGLPIYDDCGKIKYVFSTSKDVKEINELLEKIAGMIQEIDVQKRELEILRQRVATQKDYVFESTAMKRIQKIVTKIAPTDVTVLIEGESGTGKEVVADLICQCSNRYNQPFVKINCGLIPKDLMETDLFGYKSGTFTGADKEGRIGKIETANMGTVFLDEIGDMPLPLQVKLLEFLQDRTITRVGDTKRIPIDVRIIAATNRNLQEMVQNGEFRGDLYYRLNVIPLKLLPLCERKEDILPLANVYLKKFNLQYNQEKHLDAAVLDELYKYNWPGNVRELMHILERLIITSESDKISVEALMDVLNPDTQTSGNIICTGIIPLQEARIELENLLIKGAYEKMGTTYKAAQVLGVNQSTVVRILNKLKATNADTHNT